MGWWFQRDKHIPILLRWEADISVLFPLIVVYRILLLDTS
jgi:hypothetical protein